MFGGGLNKWLIGAKKHAAAYADLESCLHMAVFEQAGSEILILLLVTTIGCCTISYTHAQFGI